MARFKAVITDFGSPDNDLESEVLDNSGLDIDLVRLNLRDPAALRAHLADADAILVQWANINRDLIASMDRCKVISRYGIGVDMVDLQAAGEYGIPVANVPDFCIEEVSLSTISFVLDLNRRNFDLHAYVRAGQWGSAPVPGNAPARLSTQTLGIVGLGNIGRAVAQKAACLGLHLLGCDPYLSPAAAQGLGVELVGLEELLRRADYVTLHCPLNDETRGLIGAPQLAQMKPTAYLINMARGPVVKQAELCQALADGLIAGAALDVLEKEPPRPDDPLLQLPNIIITPHTSSWSADSLRQLRRDTAQNVVDRLSGKLPRSIVNRAWLSHIRELDA